MMRLVEKIKENWENSVLFRIKVVTFGIAFVSYVFAVVACVLAINTPFEAIAKLFSGIMSIFGGIGAGSMVWLTILELIGAWLQHRNN